jgi:SEC-C motif-containing protein
MHCYCGSPIPYATCCGSLHSGKTLAITAEALMRSRYSAFVMANGNYLMKTHHPTTRPVKDKKAIVNWAKSVEWVKLEILTTYKGNALDTKGTVTFNAYFFENGKVDVIHEASAFVKEENRWYYLGLSQ